ncbi:MAG: hypothetical protein HY873_13325 [Chloroflexi bacterium]|nr:hypothetical protein [Chloroflexota bacterium]
MSNEDRDTLVLVAGACLFVAWFTTVLTVWGWSDSESWRPRYWLVWGIAVGPMLAVGVAGLWCGLRGRR